MVNYFSRLAGTTSEAAGYDDVRGCSERPGSTPARAMPPRLTPGPVFHLPKHWRGQTSLRNDLALDGFASGFVH